MRPERIVAAALFALAGALVALVVLGPTEGAGATPESASRSTTAAEPGTKGEPTSTEEALPTEPEVDTTTEAAGTPTSTEAEPAEPPPPLAGDGTFPGPVRMSLTSGEVKWQTVDLDPRPARVRVGARVTALQGDAGDVHGLQCGTADATYEATVDPWTSGYTILRWTGNTGVEVESGAAAGLAAPPAPNRLRLTCVALGEAVRIELAANGKRIASVRNNAVAGRFATVSVTATDSSGGQDVVFDGVVVETG